MSAIRSHISEEGKIQYSAEGIASWKPIIESCKGQDVYMTLVPVAEYDYKKDLTKYYYDWILPFVGVPLKDKGCDTLRKAHMLLLYMFAPKFSFDEAKADPLSIPIEDMTLSQRATFIAGVAVWAEKTYIGDVAQILDAGFDGVKIDNCGDDQAKAFTSRLKHINASGKAILVENSNQGFGNPQRGQ